MDGWTTTAGKVPTSGKGLAFTVGKQGDSPTIQSTFNVFFGEMEVKMTAAPGTGIVSTVVWESDDLDEIDWEILGGDTTQVQTDYFGKGNTSTYDRATYVPVSSPQTTEHTYLIRWTSESIDWSVDGKGVRTLSYGDAVGGKNFPQTPMKARIGIWAGGDPSNGQGTIEWAGGQTDYSKAPFTMYVTSIRITNYNPAASYSYGDNTGSFQSIKKSNTKVDGTFGNGGMSSSSSSSSEMSSSTSTGAPSSTTGRVSTTTSTSSLKRSGTSTAPLVSSTGGTSSLTASSSMSSVGPASTTAAPGSPTSTSDSGTAAGAAPAGSSSPPTTPPNAGSAARPGSFMLVVLLSALIVL